MTAFNISKQKDFGNSIFLRATCDCGTADHNHNIIVEIDDEVNEVVVTLYQSVYWDKTFGSFNWIQAGIKRLKGAARLLLTGRLESEGCFILSGQSIEDYAKALLDAQAELIKRKASTSSDVKK